MEIINLGSNSKIDFTRTRKRKYKPILEKLVEIKYNEVLEVKLDKISKQFSTIFKDYCRREKIDFWLKIKNIDNLKWAIRKEKKCLKN